MGSDSRGHVGRSLDEVLSEKLRDRDFAEAYEAAGTKLRLVEQIDAILNRLGWNGRKLAQTMGTSPSQVARLLKVEYEPHVSIATLLKFAAATGQTLQVRFVPSLWLSARGEAVDTTSNRIEQVKARVEALREEVSSLQVDVHLSELWCRSSLSAIQGSGSVPAVRNIPAAAATAEACNIAALAG